MGRRICTLLSSSPRPGRASSLGGSVSLLGACQPSARGELQLLRGSCLFVRGGQLSQLFPLLFFKPQFNLLRKEQKAQDELCKIDIDIFLLGQAKLQIVNL